MVPEDQEIFLDYLSQKGEFLASSALFLHRMGVWEMIVIRSKLPDHLFAIGYAASSFNTIPRCSKQQQRLLISSQYVILSNEPSPLIVI